MLGILACPDVGGDTVFADTEEAYRYSSPSLSPYSIAHCCRRFSPGFQRIIDPLRVAHTSAKMINHVKSVGGHVRRDPIEKVHPIVRKHPVTHEKSLWVNEEFTTQIVDFKPEESDWVIKKLVQHVIVGHGFQARVSWERGSAVMFDGRNTLRRCLVRIRAK